MERTPLSLPSGTYTMKVTSWNLLIGSYLMERMALKLPNET